MDKLKENEKKKENEKNELQALVVSFLQQGLKDYPYGYSLSEFERIFPERMDEENDWYKRYNKRNLMEALESIQEYIKVYYSQRSQQTFISLNLRSDKVDKHLVDLITNQRSSNKKRRHGRPSASAKALSSFSLNRQYGSSNYNRRPSYNSTRLNHRQDSHAQDSRLTQEVPTPPAKTLRPSIYSKTFVPDRARVSTADPRVKSSAASMKPPQVPTYSKHSPSTPSAPSPITSNIPVKRLIPPKPSVETIPKSTEEDPVLVQKKSYLRQRIMSLLTRKFSEIKILHLNGLYQLEFEESIDPVALGHKGLTNLLQDPILSEYIQINHKAPFSTVSARKRTAEKENVQVEKKPSSKFETSDPFDIRSLKQSLEMAKATEQPLGDLAIDETVKFKTLRLIFKSENSTLVINEWEERFYKESNNRLKVGYREYGFRDPLEFFQKLATELPINIMPNRQNQWVATVDFDILSDWLHEKLLAGRYRAITSIEARYELVGYPDDSYFYTDVKSLISETFQPVNILSIRSKDNTIWVALRVPKKIEEHLCVESSMTCYERQKDEDHMVVPKYFVKPGLPCAVYDNTQQRWCRALILKAPDNPERDHEITVLLVDYGVIRLCRISGLKGLLKTHLALPVGPILTRLSGVKDPTDFGVQHKARMVLQEYTSPPVTLACKFHIPIETNNPSYLPKYCTEVVLFDTRHGNDCNLADAINDANALPKHI